MKKDLLFVMPSLSSGGGERSLVNLLSQIDYNLYNVDLLLFNHEGLFMGLIPDQVRLLPIPGTFHIFGQGLGTSVLTYLRQGQFTLAYSRFMFSLQHRSMRNVAMKEQYGWRYMSKSILKINKRYDAAIGFLEKTSIYFCVEKVEASRKIGWIHTDYNKLGMDPNFDLVYFEKLDNIVTVSDECANILNKIFPEQSHKVNVIQNIISPSIIKTMAMKDLEDVYERSGDEVIILSVGRLNDEKGFELAIAACKLLVDAGLNVHWNIIGEGEEREKLTNLIIQNHLSEHVKLLGLKSNPYIFIKQADIYVQPSKFEGKSIAVDEAKILNKPIVLTRFNTAKDQINDGVDGLIVDMNPEAVASGIEKLIKDKGLMDRMIKNLSTQQLGTEEEINKLYRLLV